MLVRVLCFWCWGGGGCLSDYWVLGHGTGVASASKEAAAIGFGREVL